MDALEFAKQVGAMVLIFVSVLMLVGAVSTRIKGQYNGATSSPFINFSPTLNIGNPLPHSSGEDSDDENDMETGNTTTLETAGNSGETAEETPLADAEMMLVNDIGAQRLVPTMSRAEYHELVEVRVKAIDLLDRCVKYYEETGEADGGVIPRHDKIHMKPANRQTAVNNLWYSQFVVKSKNETAVDPAYFPSCKDLMQAIIEKRAKVYPMGYLENIAKRRHEAFMALPENERDA